MTQNEMIFIRLMEVEIDFPMQFPMEFKQYVSEMLDAISIKIDLIADKHVYS